MREKNQLTLPMTIVQALNLVPGDRFVLRVQDVGRGIS
ncbi:MAG: AbrB/MazE/SpoVT family DNA-binding domain-containing protein [Chloroflexota bacterium]|nr:AbrB/MazE/SpoVT family DNA-binding domain-containing protein [Chloroflexota bacterium]